MGYGKGEEGNTNCKVTSLPISVLPISYRYPTLHSTPTPNDTPTRHTPSLLSTRAKATPAAFTSSTSLILNPPSLPSPLLPMSLLPLSRLPTLLHQSLLLRSLSSTTPSFFSSSSLSSSNLPNLHENKKSVLSSVSSVLFFSLGSALFFSLGSALGSAWVLLEFCLAI